MNHNGRKVRLLHILIVATSMVYSPTSQGGIDSEYLLFPFLGANFRSDLSSHSLSHNDDYNYGVDIFVASEYRNFLFLGELLLSKHEQHIERLQLGWTAGDSKIWFGRFHNPIGYWNSQFHHGANLQTSISRPSIVEFEHDDGILPMHLTGLLVEGVLERDNQGLGYAFAVAVGPELSDKLEALDVLNPGSGSQDLSLTFALYHEPVLYSATRYGLFVNYNEIPAVGIGIDEVHQVNAGVYGRWDHQPWRFTGSMFYLHNSLQQVNLTPTDDFVSGYFQAENNLDDQWTIFGRVEWTFAGEDDIYLALLPHYVKDRVLGGFRLDAFGRHSFKLEISGNRVQGDNFGQVMLQWDAMF